MTKHNTPALRFGEYSQPWVEVKNNRIFAPTDERGFAGLPVLSATQKDGFIPRSMLGKEISYNKDAEKTYKRVLPDDFAIHLRSFQGGFAHSKYEGITSPAYTTFRLRQASQHDGLFWKYFFTSPLFIQSLTKVTYGIRDGRSIGAEEYFLEDSCFPPNREEQRAIGELFADLDVLIEQRLAKHANLQQTKTALMQRMFPQDGADEPELRLGGFSGAWDWATLGDFGRVGMNKRIFKHQTAATGDIPFYKIGTFGKKPDAFISKSLYDAYRAKYPHPSKGAVLVSASGSIGRTLVYDGQPAYFQDSNIIWLDHDDRLFDSYLEQFYSIANWNGIEGTTIRRLYNEQFLAVPIPSPPTIEEQRAIGEMFSSLDALIAAESRYITQLTQAKTALLQRMFV